MAKKKRRKRKNSAHKTTSLTKEQFTKLECDAHAFLEVAQLTREHMNKIQPYPMSTAYTSFSTAIMTNLGMGFELKLKTVHYKASGFIPHTHVLVEIYDSLDAGTIKSKLTDIYEECLKDTPDRSIGTAYIFSKRKPSPTPNPQARNLREFLSYLDQVGLYNRRYSFASFSNHEQWLDIQSAFLTQLINRITEFTNSLPDPDPP